MTDPRHDNHKHPQGHPNDVSTQTLAEPVNASETIQATLSLRNQISQNARSGKRTAATMTIAASAAAAVAFFVNLLSARALGPSLRGEVAFILQLSYFLAPVLIFAGDKALLRRTEGRRHGQEFFVPGRLFLWASTAIVLCILLLVFRDWRALAAPAATTTAWFAMRRADSIRTGAFGAYVLPFAVYQTAILCGSLGLFLLKVVDWRAWLLVYLLILPLVAFVTPSTYVSNRLVSPRINLGLTCASLMQLFALRGERILLPLVASTSQLGLYIVVATASEPLYWLAQALADHRTGDTGQTDSLSRRVRQVCKETFLVSIVATAAALALSLLLVPLFGESFRPALPLIPPLTLAAVTLFAYRQFAAWTLAGVQPSGIVKIEGTVGASAAVVYPVGILWGEAVGAAWACVVVYAIGVVISFLVFRSSENQSRKGHTPE